MKKNIDIPDDVRWDLEIMAKQEKKNLKTFIQYVIISLVREQKKKTANEWLYVFGFATHILSFKARKPIVKTDIYNVLATGGL